MLHGDGMSATRQKWGYRGDQGTPIMSPISHTSTECFKYATTSIASLLLASPKISLSPTQEYEIRR